MNFGLIPELDTLPGTQDLLELETCFHLDDFPCPKPWHLNSHWKLFFLICLPSYLHSVCFLFPFCFVLLLSTVYPWRRWLASLTRMTTYCFCDILQTAFIVCFTGLATPDPPSRIRILMCNLSSVYVYISKGDCLSGQPLIFPPYNF